MAEELELVGNVPDGYMTVREAADKYFPDLAHIRGKNLIQQNILRGTIRGTKRVLLSPPPVETILVPVEELEAYAKAYRTRRAKKAHRRAESGE